jgi:hypothetical protein
MRDEEHRKALFFLKAMDQLVQSLLTRFVDTSRWFIQQKSRWITEECKCHQTTLELPS